MTIILDNVTVPEKGELRLKVDVSFNIKITAAQARRKVDTWLLNEVSYMIGAKEPTLIIVDGKGFWRVPAWIAFSSHRWKGVVGTVDVDVETGEIIDLERSHSRIVEYLEKEVKPLVLPYQPRTDVPVEFIPKDIPPAKRLVVGEDGYLKLEE